MKRNITKSFALIILWSCNKEKQEPILPAPSSNVEAISEQIVPSLALGKSNQALRTDSRVLPIDIREFGHKLSQICGKDLAAIPFAWQDGSGFSEKLLLCQTMEGVVSKQKMVEKKSDTSLVSQVTGMVRAGKKYPATGVLGKFEWFRFLRYFGDCKSPFGRNDHAGTIKRDNICLEVGMNADQSGLFFQGSIDSLDKSSVQITLSNPEGELPESLSLNIDSEEIYLEGEENLIRWIDTASAVVDSGDIELPFEKDRENLANILRIDSVMLRLSCKEKSFVSENKNKLNACRVRLLPDAFGGACIFNASLQRLETKRRYRLFLSSNSETNFVDFEI